MEKLDTINNLQESVPSSQESPEAESATNTTQGTESATLNADTAQTEPTPTAEVKQEESAQNQSPKSPKAPRKKTTAIVLAAVLIVSAIFAGCLIFLTYSGNNTISQDDKAESGPIKPTIDQTPVSVDNLSFEFLRLEDRGENIVYSPLSIKYALAMLSDAASGESKTQIDDLIGQIEIKSYVNNEHRSLANAMFVRDSRKNEILDSYIKTLEQKYNADVIYDSFASVAPFNNWISSKTFGLISDLFNEKVLDSGDFILANALAIDMNWNNELQCDDRTSEIPCKYYSGLFFNHENYTDSVKIIRENFDEISFNGQEVAAAQIGASANKYDIVSELGEDYIRSTVQAAYDEWLEEAKKDKNYPTDYDIEFDIDKYMEELDANYGKTVSSTDFYFLDTDSEKVFAKDLQEYDGSTLQYVGIMPKNSDVNSYVKSINSEKITNIINNLNNVATIDGFKEGVITKLSAYIPFFDFDYDLNLKGDLNALGVTDIFSIDDADLSQMTSTPYSHIEDALHKANISFSNDGIKAAAATALAGGLGAGGINKFEYRWDVPVEEIDLTFDQPFIFIIYDKDSNEIWFTGAVYNPTK